MVMIRFITHLFITQEIEIGMWIAIVWVHEWHGRFRAAHGKVPLRRQKVAGRDACLVGREVGAWGTHWRGTQHVAMHSPLEYGIMQAKNQLDESDFSFLFDAIHLLVFLLHNNVEEKRQQSTRYLGRRFWKQHKRICIVDVKKFTWHRFAFRFRFRSGGLTLCLVVNIM